MRVDYSKLGSKDEAYRAVKGAITPELISTFKVKATLDYAEDKIIAKGKGFVLEMEFFESYCEIKTDLSLLLRPLKTKVLSSIEHQLKKVI